MKTTNSTLQRLHIIHDVGNRLQFLCIKLTPPKKQDLKRPGLLGHPEEPKRNSIIQGCFAVHGHVSVKFTWLKHRLMCTNISFIFVSELTRWLTKTLCSSPSSRDYSEIYNLCTANFLSPLSSFWFSPTVNARSITPTLYLGKAAAWWTTVKQTIPATKKPSA